MAHGPTQPQPGSQSVRAEAGEGEREATTWGTSVLRELTGLRTGERLILHPPLRLRWRHAFSPTPQIKTVVSQEAGDITTDQSRSTEGGGMSSKNEWGESLCKQCDHPKRQHVGNGPDAVCWGLVDNWPCDCKEGAFQRV